MYASRTIRRSTVAALLVVLALVLTPAAAIAAADSAFLDGTPAVLATEYEPALSAAAPAAPAVAAPPALVPVRKLRTATPIAATPSPTRSFAAASGRATVPVRKARTVRSTAAARVTVTSSARGTTAGTEAARARSILAGLVRQHPILRGTTVTIGSTPGGYQAVAYYRSGRIVVNRNHTASLERLLGHEIWHVIDWRDNGRIDWFENVPPRS